MEATLDQAWVACNVCGLVHAAPALKRGFEAECARCGAVLERRTRGGFHLTAAFTLCALLLYVPANLFPVLRMELYGQVTENTVWSGVVSLYQSGDAFIAIVVFLASMLVPLLKILGLLFLVATTRFRWPHLRHFRTRVYRFIDRIGRWAMLDVFVLAILISLVKLDKLAAMSPGPGAYAFTLVVVFTLCASASFDPREIWEGAA